MPRKRTGKDIPCEHCDKPFYHSPSQIGKVKYCSPRCKKEAGRITNNCPQCGKDFITQKSRDYKYCSRDCANKTPWNKGKSYILPKRRERELKMGAKICNCKWCGKEFYNPKWRIEMNMMCCSYEHARLFAQNKDTIEVNCKGCGIKFRSKQRSEKGKMP